jgi:adenosylcobinamide-GDP ribazoletransferase
MRGLVTALRTLTLVPVPGREAAPLNRALTWFPVAGLLLGLLQYGAARAVMLATRGCWAEGAAVITAVLGVVLTRGLHLDGLADTADALGALRDREKALRIMKDSSTGAFGVTALVVDLLARFVCVKALLVADAAAWILAAAVISRTLQAAMAGLNDYARGEGGTGAPFIGRAGRAHVLPALLVCLVVLAPFRRPAWAAALGICWLLMRLYGAWCRRRFGGLTGDLLGAGNELCELTVLVLGAAMS